jgi:hypothetical protein
MTKHKMAIAAFAAALLVAGTGLSSAEPFESNRADNLKEVVVYGETRVPRWLADTITRAAQVTGVHAMYMLALAEKESSFSHRVKAPTSSAVGLYQFLEGTWLEVLNEHAAKHGFTAAADAITVIAGRATVTNSENRRWILSLREDPYLSALMAGELVKKTQDRLAQERDGKVTQGELYLAHLLGSAGASRLLKLVDERPQESAAKAFQAAAKANKSVFYAGNKKKDATVAEVHARISEMIESRVMRYAGAKERPRPGLRLSSADPMQSVHGVWMRRDLDSRAAAGSDLRDEVRVGSVSCRGSGLHCFGG